MAAPLLSPISEMLMSPIIGIADMFDESLRNFGVLGEWIPNMFAQPIMAIEDSVSPLAGVPFLGLITRPLYLFTHNLGQALTR